MIAASIVTYHTPADEIRTVIDTLRKSPIVKRIDVIDNSKDNYIADFVATYTSGTIVNYIPNDNTGYGAANNISMRRSLEDSSIRYHLVLNSDILFSADTIERLASLMDSDPSIGMTIPMVTDITGKEQSSYHPLPSPSDLIIRRFVPEFMFKRRRKRYNLKVEGNTRPMRVPYIHGCFMMISTEALRRNGLFDERFFMYPEDIDLSRRINSTMQVLVIPYLSIVHNHRAESRHSLRMLWIHVVNMIRYFNKWGWRSGEKE